MVKMSVTRPVSIIVLFLLSCYCLIVLPTEVSSNEACLVSNLFNFRHLLIKAKYVNNNNEGLNLDCLGVETI